MESAAQQSQPPAETKRGWRFWAIMISLSIASLLAALDTTSISTAMPTIIDDLGSSYAYIWIANAYILTLTGFQPLFGQTANIFGRRALTLFSVAAFAVGSAVAGPAPNLGVLIAGRAIQGIGGAGLTTMVEMIVCDLVPLRERGNFMGFIFAIYAIGISIGPVIGGVLADRVTWRWIFYLNLPIAAVAFLCLVLSLRVLPSAKDTTWRSLKRVDFGSNAILLAAVTAVLLALTWGGVTVAWASAKTLVPLVLGLLGLVLFLAVQAWVPEPTMPLRLFSNRTSLAGFNLTFIHHMLLYWILFLFPIYFQAILEVSPTTSGAYLLPTAVLSMPFAIVSGAVLSKFGRYRPIHFAGFICFAVAFGLFTRLNPDSTKAYWAGIQCIGAIAIGVITTITLPTIQAPLPEADVAVATATWGFLRGFGGIWGMAIPGAIFNTRVNTLLYRLQDADLRDLLSNGGAYALASSDFVSSLDPAAKDVVKSIYSDSLKLCWQVGLGFALLGFLIIFAVKEITLRTELETEFGMDQGEKQKDVEDRQGSSSDSKDPVAAETTDLVPNGG